MEYYDRGPEGLYGTKPIPLWVIVSFILVASALGGGWKGLAISIGVLCTIYVVFGFYVRLFGETGLMVLVFIFCLPGPALIVGIVLGVRWLWRAYRRSEVMRDLVEEIGPWSIVAFALLGVGVGFIFYKASTEPPPPDPPAQEYELEDFQPWIDSLNLGESDE